MKFMIGKAKVEVSTEGCVECGTLWAPGWSIDREVPVIIGKRRGTVDLSICGPCRERREREAASGDAPAPARRRRAKSLPISA